MENQNIINEEKGNDVNHMLAAAYLESKGFQHHEANDKFEDLNMPYYAKDAILLFYNSDRTEYELSDYLAGHGEMRNGKLHVTTFRWINKKEQLSQIYQAIIGRGLPL
jgi:hypothetical protein